MQDVGGGEPAQPDQRLGLARDARGTGSSEPTSTGTPSATARGSVRRHCSSGPVWRSIVATVGTHAVPRAAIASTTASSTSGPCSIESTPASTSAATLGPETCAITRAPPA